MSPTPKGKSQSVPRNKIIHTPIPTRWVGPVSITGEIVNEKIKMPLATFETPLWPSVARGARTANLSGGIKATLIDERMSRSILFDAPDASVALATLNQLKLRRSEMAAIITEQSRFARLIDFNSQIVGNLLYLRLELTTGDASGHNMVTLAADNVQRWILKNFSALKYTSISGNFCTDKKASAVNGILGRGKNIITEVRIPRQVCTNTLRSTPEKIADLNLKKNLLGTLVAGGIRSANAHFANMLLAFYLATGQDAANIVEGSQGFVHTEVQNDTLYFSVTLPNLIMGTVGNGKDLPVIKETLERLGCCEDRKLGDNARRLAIICAASVLCGELSLLAAQTNPGELINAHVALERK